MSSPAASSRRFPWGWSICLVASAASRLYLRCCCPSLSCGIVSHMHQQLFEPDGNPLLLQSQFLSLCPSFFSAASGWAGTWRWHLCLQQLAVAEPTASCCCRAQSRETQTSLQTLRVLQLQAVSLCLSAAPNRGCVPLSTTRVVITTAAHSLTASQMRRLPWLQLLRQRQGMPQHPVARRRWNLQAERPERAALAALCL